MSTIAMYETGEPPMLGDLVEIISRYTVVEIDEVRNWIRCFHDNSQRDGGWVEPRVCRLLARAESAATYPSP